MANENNTAPVEEQQTQEQAQADNNQAATPTASVPQQESSSTASPSRPTARKPDYEKDVVYLYQFSRSPLAPSVSPYCLKVEMWLRIAGIKYENIDHKLKYKSKKGQLPFVELNGEEVADSDVIIRRLSDHFDQDLDQVLTGEQRSISHAFSVMLDQFTTWAVKWWRFSNPGDFMRGTKLNVRAMVNSCLPAPVLNFVAKLRFRSKLSSVKTQGLGLHSPQEIEEFAEWDLKALSEFLADKPYFFGDQPSVLDCIAFAHLVQILCLEDVEYPLKTFVQESCSNLVTFVERLKQQYWPDWTELTNTLDLNTHLPKPAPSEDKKSASDEKIEKETGDDKTRESDGETEKGDKDEKEKVKDKEIEDEPKKGIEDENKRAEEAKKE